MKTFVALLLLLPAVSLGQQTINCAPNTPCTTAGPLATGAGDQAGIAMGKVNANFAAIPSELYSFQPLSIVHGGTGHSSAAAALNALLPTFIPGDCLGNDGSMALWVTCGTGGGGILGTLNGGTGAASLSAANLPVFTGAITPGDCVQWVTSTSIGDSGTVGCASGGGGSGTVNTGTAGQLAGYASSGTAVSGTSVGAGLVVSGTTLSAAYNPRTFSGTSDTILSSDCAGAVQYTSAAAVAVTLPQATGSFAGCSVDILAAGTGTVTVTPTTSTINGGASITIPASRSANITAGSGNYIAFGTYQDNVLTSPLTGGAANALSVNVNGYIGGQGLQNICTQAGTPCHGDTYWKNETLSCSGSPATVTTTEVFPASYVGAQVTVTGCGPAEAQNVVGGIVIAGGPLLTVTNLVGTCTTGTYTSTSLIGGSGTGAVATVVCNASGVPSSVTVTTAGSGYSTGDAFTFTVTGSSGTGATAFTVASGSGYAASPAPIAGDYIVISGGTLIGTDTVAFTGALSATGVLTVTGASGGQFYLGTMISNVGGTTVPTGVIIQDFITGTGGNGTYQTTYSGAAISAESMTSSNPTVLRVLVTHSGSVSFAGVVAGGRYSTAPGSPQTQGSTSGSGTGATFKLSYIGGPLYGQVASVLGGGGWTFATGVNAVTTVSSVTEQFAIGHFDDAAVSATLATGGTGIFFPQTTPPSWGTVPLGYGFQNPITLPSTYRTSTYCNGSRIIALAPMSAQFIVPFQATTSLFFKSVIDNCDAQGMGIAQKNYSIGGAHWELSNSVAENASVQNVYVGDAAKDNAADVLLSNVIMRTDTNAVPQWNAYNYEVSQSADNQASNVNGSNTVWGGALLNGADDQIRNSHFFAYAAGPCYDIEGIKAGIDGICDNQAPGQSGYYLNSTLFNIHDGWMDSFNQDFSGQYGVYVNNDGRGTIGCGIGFPNASWSPAYANLVFFGVTQVTTRVAPCIGMGGADANTFVNNLTVAGTCTGCGASGAAYTYTGTANYTVSDTNGKLFQASDPGATSNNYPIMQPGATGTAAAITVGNINPASSATDLAFAMSAKNAAAASGLAGGNTSQNAGNGDGAAAGGNASMNGGTGGATGAGGNVNITGGTGGSTSGAGGTVAIKGGPVTSGTVGPVTIQNSTGGALNLNAGSGAGITNIGNGTGTGNVVIGNSANQTNLTSAWIAPNAVKWMAIGTGPTLGGTGLGTGPTLSPAFGSTKAFGVLVGTAPSGAAVTLTALGTLAGGHFWDCQAWDRTTTTITGYTQSAVSTSSATITLSATPTAGDQLVVKCDGV